MKESYRQKPFLTLAAGVAAMALLLAGCGGGSSSTPTTPEPTPPPPPPGPTAESLKANAADAITAAIAASMAADQAKKDAIKYAGMLTADEVNGESSMAVSNAQMVLDAEMAANAAVMDADDALQAAMTAKTAAEALPADDAGRAGAIAAAEEAIKQATAQKKMAMDIVDEAVDTAEGIQSLKEAVQMVKGNNPLADGYPKMPAAFGKDVADTVKTALASITPGTDLSAAPMHATQMNDASDIDAMTWAMIVGEDNVMMKRLGTIAADGTISVGNGALPVASIAGMTATDVAPAGTDLSATGNTDGDATASGSYMGITGAVICLGGDDGCSVTDGKLGAGWYFSPGSATELYVMGTGGSYSVATMYARYGYWLTFDTTSGAATGINTAASVGHSTTHTATLDLTRPATATADVTARYSGKAAGISTRGDASGHFTANVNLMATFGETAGTLDGSISGFQGNAVDPGWRVTLEDATLSAAATGSGIAYGGAAAGAWTTQGYGPAPVDTTGDGSGDTNQRPEGFFGTFNANFTGGGMAAGAYAARADD
ncbi:MAG: hypothetical protein OXS40_14790 [Gammaproteobacteria bacterium]|nr:hypothetical protein [Gammaproteobacteria bacterium]